MMSARRILVSPMAAALVCLCLLPVEAGSKRKRASDGSLPKLGEVLTRLSRVAELYRDSALHFTCDETVRTTNLGESTVARFEYVYRYTDEGLDDHRRPKGAERLPSAATDAVTADDADVPTLLLRPYSWVFMFEPARQRRYRYALEGPDEILGVPTLRVFFEPTQPGRADEDDWVGTAWVERSTFQIVRVEAVQADDRTMRERYRPTYRTDFDVVRNGMRFPGQVRIERRYPELTITQTYRDYRFFAVHTEEEIDAIVFRD